MCSWALGSYLPVTTSVSPRCRRTAASASWAPGNASVGATAMVGVDRPEPVGHRRDELLGRDVLREHQVERRAEPGGHRLDVEHHPVSSPERAQARSEPRAGVDQRHVEVEAHDERCGGHDPRVRGARDALRAGGRERGLSPARTTRPAYGTGTGP